MKIERRYLVPQIQQDLQHKMVFVGGPRQVGKTTMARSLLPKSASGYMNWDIPDDRSKILNREFPPSNLWVFDEIHKYKGWRNYLKGVYDQFATNQKILVTGSAKLDYYRRGGDSLQGRYHYLRLHPLSVAELGITTQSEFSTLFELGGFPEPYFMGEKIQAKRWSREYRQRLIQEDLVSLENIHDLGTMELAMMRLPELVASPLSINSLREDLQVSHKTLSTWLNIFERLYAIFRLSPFGSPQIRAVKKEQKHYHFDWTLIENEGTRFENVLASHLLKWVHYQEDIFARECELRYFRDIDGREVDFIITEKNKPIIAIEAKYNDAEISKSLKYFKKKFPNCEAMQLSMIGEKNYISGEGIIVKPALDYLKKLI